MTINPPQSDAELLAQALAENERLHKHQLQAAEMLVGEAKLHGRIKELEVDNERLREDNRVIMAADKATQADNERLRAAARLPDPTYASTDGRVCCVYCGSIEENGHSEACPWVKLNVLLSLGSDKCR